LKKHKNHRTFLVLTIKDKKEDDEEEEEKRIKKLTTIEGFN
jgi:hypothetical protein